MCLAFFRDRRQRNCSGGSQSSERFSILDESRGTCNCTNIHYKSQKAEKYRDSSSFLSTTVGGKSHFYMVPLENNFDVTSAKNLPKPAFCQLTPSSCLSHLATEVTLQKSNVASRTIQPCPLYHLKNVSPS